MINIITSFFVCTLKDEKVEERNDELVETLRKNTESPYIEKVHLFLDNEDCFNKLEEEFSNELRSGKIVVIEKGKKPLYSDLFSYANTNLKDKVCMVTNSDIYIHQIEDNIMNYLKKNILFALTRHEYDMSWPLINRYQGSHDSFIFNSPLLDDDFIENIKFTQHNWGSEAKLLQEIYKNDIRIFNPCKQIIIVHLHKSGLRENDREWIAHHSYDDPGSHHPPVIICNK
jgi:hypothetical protein